MITKANERARISESASTSADKIFNDLITVRSGEMRALLLAGVVAFGWTSAAQADTFKISVEAPKVQSADQAALCANFGTGNCTVGVEAFDTRNSGTFSTDFGTNGTITGVYSGTQISTATVYGGAGGAGNYAVAYGESPYSVSLSTTLSTGINYFGFWLSALDAGNLVTFLQKGVQVYQFTPDDLIAQLGSCSGPNAYCTNPNSNYAGQNDQLYAFVNFFDTTGSFDEIRFTESPAVGGYESDNHTVGYVTTVTGTPVNVPEPASLVLLGTGIAGLVAARRRRMV